MNALAVRFKVGRLKRSDDRGPGLLAGYRLPVLVVHVVEIRKTRLDHAVIERVLLNVLIGDDPEKKAVFLLHDFLHSFLQILEFFTC